MKEQVSAPFVSRVGRLSGRGMSSTERERLERKYAAKMLERKELRRLVTYVPNKTAPTYNWFKYKEGFSRELVHLVLREWAIPKRSLVYDPFAGCGTTLLACKELGYEALGLDILPVAVYVTDCKLKDYSDVDRMIAAVNKLMAMEGRTPSAEFPTVPIIDKAFTGQTQKDIQFYKEKIRQFAEPEQSFLMLGLLSILEEVSYTSKDGQFLRIVDKPIPKVKDALRRRLTAMLNDISIQRGLFPSEGPKVSIMAGDARSVDLPKHFRGKTGVVITSPPYLNRYDYSRTYALELLTLFVDSPEQLRDVRHSLLRSHIESREHIGKEIALASLDEVLANLRAHALNNERIPIMIKGYFEDMNQVVINLARQMKPEGLVALVVANARFEGEMIPVDLMLSELATKQGFKVEKIWVTRYKGNSSQQMAKFGREPVRESIVFWRKVA
ncbi:MAG: DNA methyltransferase [Bacteroidota bacterium]